MLIRHLENQAVVQVNKCIGVLSDANLEGVVLLIGPKYAIVKLSDESIVRRVFVPVANWVVFKPHWQKVLNPFKERLVSECCVLVVADIVALTNRCEDVNKLGTEIQHLQRELVVVRRSAVFIWNVR